jgi:hypothetical protein
VFEVELWSESRCLQEGNDLWIPYGYPKIKYEEGYIDLRALGYSVMPKPHQFWSKANKDWILPSTLVFAVGWSFEITSHLEELAFWLFLLHQVRMVETPFSRI